MNIRKAEVNDARAIAEVHVDSWRTTYKDIVPKAYLDSLSYEQRAKLWEHNMEHQTVYVAENEQGQIVGFSVGGKKATKGYSTYAGELYAIYILESQQGKGLGRLLVKPVVNELSERNIQSMIVLVLADNPSKYFYEKLGAKQIDTVEIKIADMVLLELVYGWDDLEQVNFS